MKDRIVEHPNRYRMVKTDQADVVDLIAEPGEITEVGTPINKATLLSDTTAAMYGANTVNDVLIIANGDNYALFNLSLCYPNGVPVEAGIRFYITNGNNEVFNYETDGKAKNIFLSLPLGVYVIHFYQNNTPIGFDISNITLNATLGLRAKKIDAARIVPTGAVVEIKSSGNYAWSKGIDAKGKTVPMCLINGGQYGDSGSSSTDLGGKGGDGGNYHRASVPIEELLSFSAIIAAGMGITSLSTNKRKLTGNDSGQNHVVGRVGAAGGSGTYAFNQYVAGAGGAGGNLFYKGYSGGNGGGGQGGQGWIQSNSVASGGSSGSAPGAGGGGGGGDSLTNHPGYGGAGAAGAILLQL